MPEDDIFSAARQCIAATDIERKLELTRRTAQAWRESGLKRGTDGKVEAILQPGLPPALQLVPPRQLVQRSLNTATGHAALIHAICHIEFNAINLAWDAVYRFRDLPDEFYNDWVRIAEEEACHFQLLNRHLQSLGYCYGDFPAHNGLWEMACETAHDPLVRMALVPRVLEARGLDVTPGIMQRLNGKGDHEAVKILEIIQRDEIGHVERGSYWFRFFCQERNEDPEAMFQKLFTKYMRSNIKKPLQHDARRRAGFSAAELEYLEGIS